MARISASDPFAEHVSVMKALYQEYQKTEDFDSINTINTVISDMRDLSSKQDAAVKSIIRDLSKEVKQLEVSSSYPQPEGYHKQRVAGLENDINDTRSRVTQLTDDTREAQVQRQQLAERTASAAARVEELHAQQREEESMLRRQMILYQVISKTSFRKDVGERVAGTVSDAASAELRPFDMDPHNFSHFEMVNKLWQLI